MALSGEWHAEHTTLKAEFDLALDYDLVAADAPYAAIERSLELCDEGEALDADTAKEDSHVRHNLIAEQTERYMQKWLDVSDGKHGMLVLNDCLYGYDARSGQLRLSLLRSPLDAANLRGNLAVYPEEREFTGLGPFAINYAIMPHRGDWRAVDAPRLGYEFNNEAIVRPLRDGYEPGGVWRDWWERRDSAPESIPLSAIEYRAESSLVTVMKQAEDGNGVILRLVETKGRPDRVVIRPAISVRCAIETDMLERAVDALPIPLVDGVLEADLSPWEIQTIRLVP